MPSMITVCPGCSRKGIMSKQTGKCFQCNKAAGLTSAPKARKAKVTVKATSANTSVVTVTEPPPVHRVTLTYPGPKRHGPLMIAGRRVR